MKKLFVLFAFLGMVSLVQAQCTKSAKATKGKTCCAATVKAAATAASLDDSIEKRKCAKSGKVSYVKKSVCATSGNVSFSDVEYCTKSKKFVNVSPSEMKEVSKKATCTKKATATSVSTTKKTCTAAQKAACSKKAGATATSVSAKKACCAKKASCSKSVSTDKKAEVKEVKAVKVKND